VNPAASLSLDEKVDARRELGERTRARILRATSELLAERGEDAIRLRDITDAADVNVAAVNYHFGSLKALFVAATREAVGAVITKAIDELGELDEDADLEEIVAAWARPVLAARKGPSAGQRLAFLRITARAGDNPPEDLCDWMNEIRSRYQSRLVARLRSLLPEVPEEDLRFRVRCVAGIIDQLSSSAMAAELKGKDAAEIERLLVPVMAGALSTPCEEPKGSRRRRAS
jgi:AcrR family transcriptional regulator